MEKTVVYESRPKFIALLLINGGFVVTSMWVKYWFGLTFFGLCALVTMYPLLDPRKKLLFYGTPAYRAHRARELEAWRAAPGEITWFNDGFRVPPASGDPVTVAWSDLRAVFAYKRDLYTTDEICLDVFFPDDSSFTITEETAGWHLFVQALEAHLPISPGWFADVSVPAFETKLTLLYEHGHRSFTEAVTVYYPADSQPVYLPQHNCPPRSGSFRMTRVFYGCLACILFACSEQQPADQEVRATIPVEHIVASKDQQIRREHSEAICKAHGVPIYHDPNALFVDSEAETTLRTKDQVVDRALALCFIGLKSEGLAPARLAEIDRAYHITPHLSPVERAYVTAAHPTEQQRLNANWRYESLHVLLWALGYVDTLDYPNTMCDVAHDVAIIHDLSAAQFRQRAALRSKKEVLDQADLILRLDWACTESRLANKPMPGNLNSEIIMERHHSLNWLITYGDQEWDDVSTDT